jgi:hypothetical protein
MKLRVPLACGLLTLVATLAGCQRLSYEKEHKLEGFAVKTIEFDAPRYEQKLALEVKSPGAPVSVYVVKKDVADKAETTIMSGKAPEGALGGKDKTEDATVDVTVPANTAFTVILYNTQKNEANAKLKVSGR